MWFDSLDELYMVLDEELKMMARICGEGGTIHGPYLKEMSTLIHTEYELEGRTSMDPVDAFRDSMFAATMIGSPTLRVSGRALDHSVEGLGGEAVIHRQAARVEQSGLRRRSG